MWSNSCHIKICVTLKWNFDWRKNFLLLDYTGSLMKNYVFNFSQTLIVFKKPFLLFSKMKISWISNLRAEFTIFYFLFFWRFAHVFSLTLSTKVCAENFLLFFNWKLLKKIEKGLVFTCFKKPGFPILDYSHRTKQNKQIFCTHFCRHCNYYKQNRCSKFQRKMIICTWQIGKKLISKNNNINSKDNNINMN